MTLRAAWIWNLQINIGHDVLVKDTIIHSKGAQHATKVNFSASVVSHEYHNNHNVNINLVS